MNAKNNHRSSLSTANMESGTGNGPLATQGFTKCSPRACVHIRSYRKRLTDSDGVSAKAAIDGIVKTGVLVDDSPEFVEQVSYSQEKADEEKTVITITYLPDKPE